MSQEERIKEKKNITDETKNMFSERLRLLREKKQWTQARLGKEIGLTTSSIQKFELKERFPSGIDLIMISKKFDVSIDYLIGNTENEKVEYTSFDELGLRTGAIDTLRDLNDLVYKKKRLNERAFLTLDTLNLLLTRKNCDILYRIGNLLLIKKVFDKYYSNNQTKQKGFAQYPAYDLYSFKLSKAIDKFCEENSKKCLSQALVKNGVDSEEDVRKLLAQIDGLEQTIVDNPKDYFYTPTEQKVLFAKEEK